MAANRAAAAGHRVAIIDFDVHHGNGTQSIFYDRSDVLCVSLHMNHGSWDEGLPHPETGAADEVGVGPGVGFNVNVPLDFGVGDSGYMRAFDALVVPAVDAFKPTFVVVACGVDGSQMDPNGRQLLTTHGFFELGRACRKLADKHASGRVVTTMEGGYHISYAALCVHAVLAVRCFRATAAVGCSHMRPTSSQGIAGMSSPEIPDPLAGTYPDPPLHDPTNARMDALISRLREERAAALAAALAA